MRRTSASSPSRPAGQQAERVERRATSNSFEVVTIFDAEDDIDPNIFNVVNTTMLDEPVNVVQAGVQLMNFTDHWFSIHNVLEYFFWFRPGSTFTRASG